MAECIIAGRGRSSEEDKAPIIQNRHTILLTVKTSKGDIIPDCLVKCRDGSTWYNYSTNSKGQVLFVTNSGTANIIAYNYSQTQEYQYLDQGQQFLNIDAPIGLSTTTEISLNNNIGSAYFNQMGGTFGGGLFWMAHNGNYRIIAHNKVDVTVVGGGGSGQQGSYVSSSAYYIGGGGGGGGGSATGTLNVTPSDSFKIYVGSGGKFNNSAMQNNGTWLNHVAGVSGGTTSALGFVATGGGGGHTSTNGQEIGGTGGIGAANPNAYNTRVYFGGNGGIGGLHGSNGENSNGSIGGGGGGGGGYGTISESSSPNRFYGGTPYGGNGGYANNPPAGSSDYYPQNGKSWGGGGGGGCMMPYVGGFGGSGGNGYVRLVFHD